MFDDPFNAAYDDLNSPINQLLFVLALASIGYLLITKLTQGSVFCGSARPSSNMPNFYDSRIPVTRLGLTSRRAPAAFFADPTVVDNDAKTTFDMAKWSRGAAGTTASEPPRPPTVVNVDDQDSEKGADEGTPEEVDENLASRSMMRSKQRQKEKMVKAHLKKVKRQKLRNKVATAVNPKYPKTDASNTSASSLSKTANEYTRLCTGARQKRAPPPAFWKGSTEPYALAADGEMAKTMRRNNIPAIRKRSKMNPRTRAKKFLGMAEDPYGYERNGKIMRAEVYV